MPDNLVAAAKEQAAVRGTSVSKLVSDYFRALAAAPSDQKPASLPPITSRLVGCIHGAKDDREAYIDHLERKHS